MRHHKREKRYGPSPSNNYTAGSGRFRFGRRGRKNKVTRDAELATAGGALAGEKHHHDGVGGTHNGGHNF